MFWLGSRAMYRRRTGLAARLARRAFRWRFRLLHARRHGKVDLARVRGLPLLVLPEVFHPEFFFATSFFLGYLDRRPIVPSMRVLDMGTGSGALAVALARRGATVIAVDISPPAVRCARANVLLHGLEARVTVCESDLFAALPAARFDLIVFNSPFYDRPARDLADRAWAAGAGSETVWRFLREAPCYLRPGGEILIMGSTEAPMTASLRAAPGYATRVVAQRELLGERLFLFALRPLTAPVKDASGHAGVRHLTGPDVKHPL
ncbi:MAG TPA: methyltransferase [Chloroflexota bacterium]|nr:methyltransferase [Chloroflexota bacterium]